MPDLDVSFRVCACPECVAMCQRRPCWPTPADARRLIEAGYADRLMVDWWFNRDQNKTIYLLTPAIAGREGGEAPAHPEGRCTFLDEAGLCQLHDPGLKPTEGQIALCRNRTPDGLHEQIGGMWDDAQAQTLLDRWEANPPRGRRLLFAIKPLGSTSALRPRAAHKLCDRRARRSSPRRTTN